MKKNVFYYLSAFLLIFAAGCSEMADVEPTVDQDALNESIEDQISQDENLRRGDRVHKIEGKGLKNIQVDGELEDGGTFFGMVTITSFDYDETEGLLASGMIRGIATTSDGKTTRVNEAFSDIQANLVDQDAAPNARVAAECQILFLDLGPIFLDVLGLQVDLSRIILDITAVSGAGNLLGNLLCAVAGLLDGFGFLTDFINLIDSLTGLLEQINNLLGR